MSVFERIFHAILFELGALTVAALAVMAIGLGEAKEAFFVSVVMAIMAMGWNFVFNWIYDKFHTGAREQRTLMQRVIHAILFEGGLLVMTVPVVAYLLNIGWVEAFWADLGLTLLILVYTLIFNWLYDHIRVRFVKPSKQS